MAWKKVNEEMCDILDEALSPYGCEMRQMFGCPAYFINNNMFAGFHQDTILLRLSEKDRAEIQKMYDEIAPFEPFEGRPMKEYVGFPDPLASDSELLNSWVKRSFEWASTLSPKEKNKQEQKRAEGTGRRPFHQERTRVLFVWNTPVIRHKNSKRNQIYTITYYFINNF